MDRQLVKLKSISDDVIYHPVKYKILFGAKADARLQASIKIVKNPDQVVNDNDIKARVVTAINQYFALEKALSYISEKTSFKNNITIKRYSFFK